MLFRYPNEIFHFNSKMSGSERSMASADVMGP